ncbi:hypothetical protein WN943_022358 [Citrus x changshan-huyou]
MQGHIIDLEGTVYFLMGLMGVTIVLFHLRFQKPVQLRGKKKKNINV